MLVTGSLRSATKLAATRIEAAAIRFVPTSTDSKLELHAPSVVPRVVRDRDPWMECNDPTVRNISIEAARTITRRGHDTVLTPRLKASSCAIGPCIGGWVAYRTEVHGGKFVGWKAV